MDFKFNFTVTIVNPSESSAKLQSFQGHLSGLPVMSV